MANPLSVLGIVHTAISVAPVVAGLYGFAKYGAIRPKTHSGRLYLATLALSVLTSFGLSSTGGLNPGHVIGIVTLLAAGFSLAVARLGWLGRLGRYLAALAMSFTFFLLMIPGLNETLSRLPPSAPIGNGPDSPPVQTALMAWTVIFLVGLCLQVWSLRRRPAGPSVPV